MKYTLIFAVGLVTVFTLSVGSEAYAHGGRTAADGCHNDKKAGTRHCHGAKSKSKRAQPKASYQGTSSVYYPNCTAARNAGKSRIKRGQPGYGKHLDRDGDGIACE